MKMYQQEAVHEEAKLEKMKSDGTDEYVVRKQVLYCIKGALLVISRQAI